MTALTKRVDELEANSNRQHQCIIVVLPGDDRAQKEAQYVADHGHLPVGVIRVEYVKPPLSQDDAPLT